MRTLKLWEAIITRRVRVERKSPVFSDYTDWISEMGRITPSVIGHYIITTSQTAANNDIPIETVNGEIIEWREFSE